MKHSCGVNPVGGFLQEHEPVLLSSSVYLEKPSSSINFESPSVVGPQFGGSRHTCLTALGVLLLGNKMSRENIRRCLVS